MSMHFFNPIRNIIESKSNPHARTLRTGLYQKFRDSINVIRGENNHAGILDWLTLGIPRLFSSMFNALIELTGGSLIYMFIASPLLLPLFLINLAFNVVLGIAARALAIVSLPVTLTVSVISYFIARHDKNLLPRINDIETLITTVKPVEGKGYDFMITQLFSNPFDPEYVKIKNAEQLQAIYHLNIGGLATALDDNLFKLVFEGAGSQMKAIATQENSHKQNSHFTVSLDQRIFKMRL